MLKRDAYPRCDVHINARKEGATGKPSCWSTWWIFDGSDDADAIRAADVRGKLNEQVRQMLQDFQVSLVTGTFHAVEACLTGDGKAMLNSNFMEGHRCWLCDTPMDQWLPTLSPNNGFPCG